MLFTLKEGSEQLLVHEACLEASPIVHKTKDQEFLNLKEAVEF